MSRLSTVCDVIVFSTRFRTRTSIFESRQDGVLSSDEGLQSGFSRLLVNQTASAIKPLATETLENLTTGLHSASVGADWVAADENGLFKVYTLDFRDKLMVPTPRMEPFHLALPLRPV
jgi:hypothetical protein